MDQIARYEGAEAEILQGISVPKIKCGNVCQRCEKNCKNLYFFYKKLLTSNQ